MAAGVHPPVVVGEVINNGWMDIVTIHKLKFDKRSQQGYTFPPNVFSLMHHILKFNINTLLENSKHGL